MNKLTSQFVTVFLFTILLGGCGGRQNVLWEDMEQLQQENTDLSLQVQSLQEKNTQLTDQVNTLAGLNKQIRLQALDTLETIRLHRRTGLYDLDEDGTKETLVVYVEPLDTAQDTVKAAGSVNVQLWNLDVDSAEAKLADWTLSPVELQQLWGGNIFASYYRLPFPISDILTGAEKELTVKVTFMDYQFGKVLTDQTTIIP